MKLGDTFLITKPGKTLDSHLWVVLSDPAQNADKILIVNVTTHKGMNVDESCILEIGDHPWIKKKSYVHYLESEVKVIKASDYAALLYEALINPQQPFRPDVLARVLNGAAVTDLLGLGQREWLKTQGLI